MGKLPGKPSARLPVRRLMTVRCTKRLQRAMEHRNT
jgi:hypothetical protein